MTGASGFDQGQQIVQALEEAHALRHPQRAMRVTLECGHLRLMPWINTVMGIGALTACDICPKGDDGYSLARTVVNVEETGVLHDSWRPSLSLSGQRTEDKQP